MKKSISTHEAKTHLSKLIEDAMAGDEVVICRGKTPVVKIVRYQNTKGTNSRPKVGEVTSAAVKYSEDAFLPLVKGEDLKEWGVE